MINSSPCSPIQNLVPRPGIGGNPRPIGKAKPLPPPRLVFERLRYCLRCEYLWTQRSDGTTNEPCPTCGWVTGDPVSIAHYKNFMEDRMGLRPPRRRRVTRLNTWLDRHRLIDRAVLFVLGALWAYLQWGR